MMRISQSEVIARLRKAESFLVTSHVGPDGDAIGSILAMDQLLRGLGKEKVCCALDGAVPEIYRWLPGADKIVPHSEVKESFEMGVVLDVSDGSRVGAAHDLVSATSKIMVIDHHLSGEPWGDYGLTDSSCSATGVLVAELFKEAGLSISREVAECLYVAITTDTGGFRHANTDPRTHRLAADLVEKGVDVALISRRVFDRMSRGKFGLLTRFAQSVEFSSGGRVALGCLRSRDFEASGALEEETEGLINFPRNVGGVEVAVLLRETGEGKTKMSLRGGNGVNCAEIASAFGGGGHAGAAGATLNDNVDEARDLVLKRISEYLKVGE